MKSIVFSTLPGKVSLVTSNWNPRAVVPVCSGGPGGGVPWDFPLHVIIKIEWAIFGYLVVMNIGAEFVTA